MFGNIHEKLKLAAYWIAAASIILGVFWFLASLGNHNNIGYYSSFNVVSGIIGSISLVIIGILISYLFYGLGEIISNQNINNTILKNIADKRPEGYL